MADQDLLALLSLFAIPSVVVILLLGPSARRNAAMPRRDGPLAAVVGGFALAAWVYYAGPIQAQSFLAVGLAIAVFGLVWHLARTVRRLNAAQI